MPGYNNIHTEKQTLFLKMAWTLEPFRYAGDKAAIGGTQWSKGPTQLSIPVDWANVRGVGGSWAAGPPQSMRGTLRIKKSVASLLTIEEWLEGIWHLDVRYQIEGQRNASVNWTLIERYNRIRFDDYKTSDETALSGDDRAEVMIGLDFMAPARYMVRFYPLVASAHIPSSSRINALAKVFQPRYPRSTRPSMDAVIIAGTEKVTAIHAGGRGKFGRSEDSGKTWLWQPFNGDYGTPDWPHAITGVAGVPERFFVVSEGAQAHAYSEDGGANWTEVVFDQYTNHAPKDIAMYGSTNIWICGADGYIWFSSDGETGQVVHAGKQIKEDLYRIKALTDRFVVAVGHGNTILKGSRETWVSIVGPASKGAQDILDVGLYTPLIWALGYSDGTLFWTEDAGQTWTEDPQIALAGYSEIRCVDVDPVGRWVIAGTNVGGTATISHENVNGAAGHWQALVTGDVIEPHAICRINENEFVVSGSAGVLLYGSYRLMKA